MKKIIILIVSIIIIFDTIRQRILMYHLIMEFIRLRKMQLLKRLIRITGRLQYL